MQKVIFAFSVNLSIQQDVSLLSYNTFGIEVKGRFFAKITSSDQFREVMAHEEFKSNKLILGGGSNVLFTDDFDGLVLKNEIMGIELIKEDERYAWLKVGAGEVWHDFVLDSISKGYSGLENLSLIPGLVGASPMQNIGAYGVEVKNLIEWVECLDMATGEEERYSNEECQFAYRSSIFKTSLKEKKFITYVVFRLNKVAKYNTSYGAIEDELKRMNVSEAQC